MVINFYLRMIAMLMHTHMMRISFFIEKHNKQSIFGSKSIELFKSH